MPLRSLLYPVLFLWVSGLLASLQATPGTVYDDVVANEVQVRVWIPDNVTTLRGAFVNPDSLDVTKARVRETAAALDFAAIGLQISRDANSRPRKLSEALDAALAHYANQLGQPQFATAPLIFVGFSAGGGWSTNISERHPVEQTLAIAPVEGGWGKTTWDADRLSIPMIFTRGTASNFWPDWWGMPETGYDPGRALGALWTDAVQHGLGHTFGSADKISYSFLVEMAERRLVNGSVLSMSEGEGWLADRDSLTSAWPRIWPYADYPGDPASAIWLPSPGFARTWRAFNNNFPDIFLLSPANNSVISNGGLIGMPTLRNDVHPDTEYRWYANGQLLATQTEPAGSFDWQSPPPGAHVVWVESVSADNRAITSKPSYIFVEAPTTPWLEFVRHPGSIAVDGSGPVYFETRVSGSYPLLYQWIRNNTDIPGATEPVLRIESAGIADGDVYQCRVINTSGVIVSDPAVLTVQDPAAPYIISDLADQSVVDQRRAHFAVLATGFPEPTYQWRKDGIPVPGAVNARFTPLADASVNNGAVYDVVLMNKHGSVTSAPATLTVISDTVPPRLVGVIPYGLEYLDLYFDEPLSPGSIGGLDDFHFSPDVTTHSVSLMQDLATLRLRVGPMLPDTAYALQVTDLTDQAPAPNTVSPEARVFRTAELTPGWFYTMYPGIWANFTGLENRVWGSAGEREAIGTMRETSLGYFAVIFQGVLNVPATGTYSFHVNAISGAALSIDGVTILDETGLAEPVELSVQQTLEAGAYPIKASFISWQEEADLALEWEGPGLIRQAVSSSFVDHSGTGPPNEPQLVEVAFEGDHMPVTIATDINTTYQLDVSEDLSPEGWEAFGGPFSGTGDPDTLRIPVEGPSQFVRVRATR